MSNASKRLPDAFVAPVCTQQIQILYEDPYLLVIDKPSGLLSLSGKNPLNWDSVHYRLVQDYPSVTLAHRLDFGTSGLMILALSKEVNAQLTKQFQARSIVKVYQAVLLGSLPDDEGVIDAPIAKAEFPYQKVCTETGKPAQSHYRVVQRTADSLSGVATTHVEFTPTTGRTHQLRVHSLAIGHPIIGCDLYRSTIDGINSESLAPRLMLHASRVEFTHPVSEQRLQIVAPNLNLRYSV
ncbi:RluA family pseudouridine synthase [Arenicella xantha]|uniref:tRNA pseudouridine32 synthase/23S rRNA pseudouridine746 synthase n=1 Tax=Arenicella xantha TaxID=644221 RepID=A0A395JKB3_9GAMM|nr:RluA family pseudouridine synthase [Arenicella xantha]RBP51216.1 tRNA pseudouridine32 synthase/23S rRNA pseudouridine746 synthase [Arenicella xantha]